MQRHGPYTPRQAIYSATVGVNCDPPIYNATALSESNIYRTDDYTRIKMRKGSFTSGRLGLPRAQRGAGRLAGRTFVWAVSQRVSSMGEAACFA